MRQALTAAALLDTVEALSQPGEAPRRRLSTTLEALSGAGALRHRALEDAGHHLSASGLSQGALEAWEALLQIAPGHVPTLLETARAALEAGRPERIEPLVERATRGVEVQPMNARLEVAALAAAHFEPALARALLGRGIESAPGGGEGRDETGRAAGRGQAGLAARVEVLIAGLASDGGGGDPDPHWDEAMRRLLELRADEHAARLEVASWLLSTSSGRERRSAARAIKLLEPLVATGSATREALELMLVALLRRPTMGTPPGLAASPATLLDELDRRFPGGLVEAALIVQALVERGDEACAKLLHRMTSGTPSDAPQPAPATRPDDLAQRFARALVPVDRQAALLADALEGRQLERRLSLPSGAASAGFALPHLSPAMFEILERIAASIEPRWSPDRVRLEIALARERGAAPRDGGAQAPAGDVEAQGRWSAPLATAASAQLASPGSEAVAMMLAREIAVSQRGRSPDPAALALFERLVAGPLAAGPRRGLFDAEGRLLQPGSSPELQVAIAHMALAERRRLDAVVAWQRARADLLVVRTSRLPTSADASLGSSFAPRPAPFVTHLDPRPWLTLGLELVAARALPEREARGFLATCFASRVHPHAALCRELISPSAAR